MENNTFKGSLFGGFNRQDVINYIEKASKESAALLDESTTKISALEEELDTLRKQYTALQEEFKTASADSQAKYEDEISALNADTQTITDTLNTTKNELASEQEHSAALQSKLDAAIAKNQQCQKELLELMEKIELLQPEVDEYHKLKNNIVDIEVEGRQRADSAIAEATAQVDTMVKKAQAEADAVIEKAKTQAEEILRKANADASALASGAKEQAEKTINEANQNAAAIRQKAEQHAVLTRQQLNALLTNTQNQYSTLIDSYKNAALQAATALQKAQENMTQLPNVFDKINNGITKLTEGNQKKG